MPKSKRPVPRKPSPPVVDEDERLAKTLADLALDLAEEELDEAQHGRTLSADALSLKEDAFNKLVRNALRKKNDELLYSAIEYARDADASACRLLRERVGEAAATLLIRREGAPSMEINAFAIPLFVHSDGGLRQEQTFQDPEAFEQLLASIQSGGLESPRAKVVVVSHAYDLEGFERLTYSQLQDMVRDAAHAMTEKKLVATPALERSMAPWAQSPFAPTDRAVELRFLLGFAMKREDDPFYQVPKNEAKADAWYEARMERFRAWSEAAAPLVKRCLAAAPEALELSFLYQDLPFGARDQALDELATLQLLSELSGVLGEADPAQLRAVAGPFDAGGELVLRVRLEGLDGGLIGVADKALDPSADLALEFDQAADALASLGIATLLLAERFDADGAPVDPQLYEAQE